ncbi:hypothetical protein H3147_05650 [Streptomyces sp. OF8]|uniref:Secreted protein/lipoprotein n=1 Tax=Streptomyces alkaliterrae TaxID=2213162 RepID=A0A5P0YK08_9ACTN|nr:hypothetical protein [Streptomyces alkaliterrae]MQS00703.1 hypothetical protein [Streptomyces alkaliterrae]
MKRTPSSGLWGPLVLCVALALTACDGGAAGESDGTSSAAARPSPTTASPSASADPHAAEKAAVLAAYDGMTTEQAKAYRQASKNGTTLEKYATLDALSKIELDLRRMQQAGTVVRGEIRHEAKVVELDLSAKTPKARLEDCVDLSDYTTYDTKAKKVIPLPTAQPLRYVATAKAERWDGRWLVIDIDTTGSDSC